MTQQTTERTVRRSITVEASQQHAFDVFTEGMSRWWPLDTHHIGTAEPNAAVIEPRAGGRWFERAADGSECDWGRVLQWQPPDRVVFAWHLDPDWKFDPDPARATEVEVRFIAQGEKTRVELEHRGFERLADRADEVREAVGGPGGWSGLLERFAEAV